MTKQRVLSNGDTATLEHGVTVTDTRTQRALTGDKLTVSDHITLAQNEYFIVDVTGSVFKYELAIEPTPLASGTVMPEDKETLSQLSPDDAKLVLSSYHVFTHFIAAPQWSGNFVTPVDAKPTDSFGMSRVLNEELSSTHRGTDFPLREGEPVAVSNSGTVVLAKELFYEGNCVVVDHGQRLFTIYMHLSKIQVKAGDKLRKGERLGLSGQTGRVTGPHLHMGVRWNGSYLDPTKLMGLTLPELRPEKARRPTGLPR